MVLLELSAYKYCTCLHVEYINMVGVDSVGSPLVKCLCVKTQILNC
jgi:hypothetical protein